MVKNTRWSVHDGEVFAIETQGFEVRRATYGENRRDLDHAGLITVDLRSLKDVYYILVCLNCLWYRK